VIFSGLAPGFVGLNQINVTLPANAPTGTPAAGPHEQRHSEQHGKRADSVISHSEQALPGFGNPLSQARSHPAFDRNILLRSKRRLSRQQGSPTSTNNR